MSNLNKNLLTIFLIVGIVFFTSFSYMFFTKEIFPEAPKHTVKLDEVRVLKNLYFINDNRNVLQQDETETNQNNTIYENENNFILFNVDDRLNYGVSNSFYIQNEKAPFSVNFNNATIPIDNKNQKYALKLCSNDSSIITFPAINIKEVLNVEKKKDNNAETREIKLESANKKLIVFLIFKIDNIIYVE